MPNDQKPLAIIIAYFRKREGTPSKVAEACKRLLDLYGSPSEAAKATGGIVKKPESISVWARFLDLPEETRELFDDGKISRSLVYDLISLAQDQELVSDVANAVVGMQCKDAIRIIQEVKKSKNTDVLSIKKRIMDEIDKEHVYLALIGLPYDLCKGLTQDEAIEALDKWLKTKKRPNVKAIGDIKELKPFIIKIPKSTYLQLRSISRNPADLIKEILMVRLREN
jgi:hypothetical protein